MELPRFFRVRQEFVRPQVADLAATVNQELASACQNEDLKGKRIAITAGSRGIARIAEITKACVSFLKAQGAIPFIVPAMGSHGGASSEGQLEVLQSLGISSSEMGCDVISSMDVVEICKSEAGYSVFLDKHANNADGILVVNRIKPHTRFDGAIESGLMKMMLIGLGKRTGAELYHRLIHNFSFDEIVRSVSGEVIRRCNVVGGLAILENAYEETAEICGIAPAQIESREAELLLKVKNWMPSLPFEKAELLIVDQIGKNISGTGMDTNVIGRKKNDHAAIGGETPDLHHIYVRSLTRATHGNASGIGLAELCHHRVLKEMDEDKTRTNCITAGHVIGAMHPMDFDNDRAAIEVACKLAGFIPSSQVTAMWILDTLHLEEVECSEAYWEQALDAGLEILSPPSNLVFDEVGDLHDRF